MLYTLTRAWSRRAGARGLSLRHERGWDRPRKARPNDPNRTDAPFGGCRSFGPFGSTWYQGGENRQPHLCTFFQRRSQCRTVARPSAPRHGPDGHFAYSTVQRPMSAPALMNALLERRGVDALFVPLQVPPQHLAATIAGMPELPHSEGFA